LLPSKALSPQAGRGEEPVASRCKLTKRATISSESSTLWITMILDRIDPRYRSKIMNVIDSRI